LTLANKLGVSAIAEGIETVEQLARLRELNCPYGQGYFFSQPLPSQAAEELIISKPQW
jgi:EAL domain-containing protein (putative c-di-GMP-specific phosphodiesterase class I)